MLQARRQIYYRDIISRPKLFRSRAEEKDKTQRTGHLPVAPLYPASYDPYQGTQAFDVIHKEPEISYSARPDFGQHAIVPEIHHKPQPQYSQLEFNEFKPHQSRPRPQKRPRYKKKENKIQGKAVVDYPIYAQVI